MRVRELRLPPVTALILNEAYPLAFLAGPIIAIASFAPWGWPSILGTVIWWPVLLRLLAGYGVQVWINAWVSCQSCASALLSSRTPDVPDLATLADDRSLVAAAIRSGMLWEPWQHRYFQQYASPGSAVDVGAHYGTHSVIMCEFFDRVHCFEPQKDVCAVLRKNLRPHPRATVHNLALSDTASSAYLSQRHSMTGLVGIADEHDAKGELVATRTLDEFELNDVRLIKIDVEGHEAAVLLGAANTVKRCHPVILLEEDSFVNSLCTCKLPTIRRAQSLKILNAWGYMLHRVTPTDVLAVPRSGHF